MFVILVLIDTVLYIINGVVLKLLWVWFVVPTFGLPALTLPVAIGVMLIANVLTSHHTPLPKNEGKMTKMLIGMTFHNLAMPAIALVGGFIAHLFM